MLLPLPAPTFKEALADDNKRVQVAVVGCSCSSCAALARMLPTSACNLIQKAGRQSRWRRRRAWWSCLCTGNTVTIHRSTRVFRGQMAMSEASWIFGQHCGFRRSPNDARGSPPGHAWWRHPMGAVASTIASTPAAELLGAKHTHWWAGFSHAPSLSSTLVSKRGRKGKT